MSLVGLASRPFCDLHSRRSTAIRKQIQYPERLPGRNEKAHGVAARDDEIRIRPGRIRPGHRGAKRPSELCRRSHARREEGWPYWEGIRPSGSKQPSSTFGRGRRAALALSSRSCSSRRHYGPSRSPSWPPVCRSAACQARRLSQARRGDPAARTRASSMQPQTTRMERRSPNDARKTGIISGSLSRLRTPRRWWTFAPSHVNS